MGRAAPPLQAIEAFLAATRSESFRAAADELALSPSAFSRRIKSLESFLGVSLYSRSGTAPRLTEAGERYRRELQPAMEAILAATRTVQAGRGARLRLMCPPSFAINWLMPHLRTYYESNAVQDVDIVISRDLNALRLGRADLAIASGPRDFDGLVSEPFLDLRGAIVSAPQLAGGRSPPRSAEELCRHTLLGLDPPADTPRDLWGGWVQSAGYLGPALPEPQRFDTWALMYEAAANGMGVTIAVPAVSESYLRDGRLKPCFGGSLELSVHYSLVYATPDIERRGDVRSLTDWMLTEMTSSVAQFVALVGDC
jgi:DNA-binding transcriptional LysR family regulator